MTSSEAVEAPAPGSRSSTTTAEFLEPGAEDGAAVSPARADAGSVAVAPGAPAVGVSEAAGPADNAEGPQSGTGLV